MKTLKGWRTILFNVAIIGVGLSDVLPKDVALYTATIGNLILRTITTTPITKSEPEPEPKSTQPPNSHN